MVLHVVYAALAADTASRTAADDEFGTCDNKSFVDGSHSGISVAVWSSTTTKEPLTKLANRGTTSSFISVRRTSHGADRGMDLMLPRAAAAVDRSRLLLIDIVSERSYRGLRLRSTI